ncbi:MAG: 50S ribosomal protein L6, partial [Terriglobales bacterium]
MSRIGKKPIAVPAGVKVEARGNVVAIQGPKGKLETHLPAGVRVEQKDGQVVAIREESGNAALHGLV